jgi:predicted transcriptional regulator of viral defense system
MKWGRLLEIVGNEPIFSSGILRAGRYDAIDLGRQLSRWSRGGRLVQLRRGLYALAPPYRKTTPHPFLIANRLRRGSYVSLQSALEYYGLIPEHSPNVTSVATGRTETLETPFGVFLYRHIRGEFFFGAERIDLPGGQEAWVAGPEKALLDFAFLTPRAAGADETKFWEEMRLQNLSVLKIARLRELGERMGGRRIGAAVRWIETLIDEEKERHEGFSSEVG